MQLRNRFLSAAIFTVTLLALQTSQVFALQDDPERGWTKTNVNIETIESFIGSDSFLPFLPCYVSKFNMRGCIRILNELGRSSTSAAMAFVTTESRALLAPANVTLLGKVGEIELIAVKNPSPAILQKLASPEFRLANEKSMVSRAEVLLAAPRLDFEMLFQSIAGNLIREGTDFNAIINETLQSVATIRGLTPARYPCYESVQHVVGCLNLLDSIAQDQEPQQAVVTKDILASMSGVNTKLIKDFGPVQLVEILKDQTPQKLDMAAIRNRMKVRVDSFKAAAAELFKDPSQLKFVESSEALVKTLPKSISSQRSIGVAITMMLMSHDGHAHLDPSQYMEEQMSNADTSISGIGIELSGLKGPLTAVTVVEGGGAEKAGVKPGDLIIKVDGKDITGMNSTDIVSLVRGPIGSQVKLTITRKSSSTPIELTVTRARVVTLNFETKIVNDFGTKYAYMKLRGFEDKNACGNIRKAILGLAPDVKGIIFDVRSNGGGLVDQATCIGGLFVGKKTILQSKDIRNGQLGAEFTQYVSEEEQITQLPMTILINGGSASASEILAGALQDYQRAWVVGTTSFGKGTMQGGGQLIHDPTLVLFQTIARFYQPSGRTNQMVGIQPDFQVYARPDMTDEEKIENREIDLTPTALPAIGPEWVQTRQPEIDAIQSRCASDRLKALDVYNAKMKDIGAADYQLLSAQEILNCATPPASGSSCEQLLAK